MFKTKLLIISLLIISNIPSLTAEENKSILERAKESGVTPFFEATGEGFANVDGGNQRGERFASDLNYGVELDMSKIAKWDGVSIVAHVETISGEGPSELVGDASTVSNIDAYNTSRLYHLYIQKEWESGYTAKTGLIAIDDDFFGEEGPSLYINSMFGPSPTLSANSSSAIWPFGVPGVFVSYNKEED